MKRIVNVAKDHKEARDWDIQQATEMSSQQRQQVTKSLKKKVFGAEVIDVRAYHRKKSV